MNNCSLPPSELEGESRLRSKQHELEVIKLELSQQEKEVHDLSAKLKEFEKEYHDKVSLKYQELDNAKNKLDSLTTELETELDENNDSRIIIKQFYRKMAKDIHPDFSRTQDEQLKRREIMAEANEAYAEGDMQALESIWNKWKAMPESVKGDDIESQVTRASLEINQNFIHLESLKKELNSLKETELFQIRSYALELEKKGKNLLNEMSVEIDREIDEIKSKISKRTSDIENIHIQ